MFLCSRVSVTALPPPGTQYRHKSKTKNLNICFSPKPLCHWPSSLMRQTKHCTKRTGARYIRKLPSTIPLTDAYSSQGTKSSDPAFQQGYPEHWKGPTLVLRAHGTRTSVGVGCLLPVARLPPFWLMCIFQAVRLLYSKKKSSRTSATR